MASVKKSATFLGLTFLFSWGLAIGVWALGLSEDKTIAFFTLFGMMAGPALAATICAFAFEKGRVREALGLKWTPNWWWLIAWALAASLALLSVVFSALFSGSGFADIGAQTIRMVEGLVGAEKADELRHIPFLSGLIVLQSLIAGLINAPFLVVTEELGWRGYLHDLWRKFGFWRASLATGFIWGVWHAPAILLYGLNYPANREIGVGLFIVFCTLLAPLMTYMRDQGRSVIAPAITHGAINGFGGLTLVALANSAFPWGGIVGYGGFIALGLGVMVLAALRMRAPSAA